MPAQLTTRQSWMRVLALSSWSDLEPLAARHLSKPCDTIRQPEAGLVMLRGRIGGTGAPFNLGEATVTRCAIRLPTGQEGHGYVMGCNPDHSRAAAVCDALMQAGGEAGIIESEVLRPLEDLIAKRRALRNAKTAATKVEFFTLVRGEVD